MGRYTTAFTLLDDVLQLRITELKRDGFLGHGSVRTGVTTWSRNGVKTGSISFLVDETTTIPFIELDYTSFGESVKYKVTFDYLPSNLGIGEIVYFVCPKTLKRCRTLYCVGGLFLHRDAFHGVFYDSQTKGKKDRELIKLFDMYFKRDQYIQMLNSKHFKKTYNGKPTKRYLELLKKLKEAEQITPSLESFLLA